MNLALFDFDGTITERDTFSSFLRFAVRRHRMVLGAIPLSPIVFCYRLGLISAHQARPIVSRVGLQGEPAGRIRDVGRRYAADVLPRVIRRQALERIHWHQGQGDTVVVVGRLTMREYDDANGGGRRSFYEIDATSVGPDLSRYVAFLARPNRELSDADLPAQAAAADTEGVETVAAA